MYQKLSRWLDPILLVGLLISITISVVMVLIGNDTISSLIIGLLTTIITLLIDAIARIQKAEGSFLDAAGLTKILSNKSLGASLQDITDSYDKINKYNFGHYDNLAENAIDECRAKLHEVASGSVVVVAKTTQGYGVKGIEQARRNVKVIHLDTMDFWDSDFGRKYFDLNRAAIKRGVQITRIFSLSVEDAKSSLDKLREQERAGVRVLIVKPSRVNKEFVIFDDEILIDFEIETGKDSRFERIILDPAQVKRKREEFQELITRYAKTVKDVLSTSETAG